MLIAILVLSILSLSVAISIPIYLTSLNNKNATKMAMFSKEISTALDSLVSQIASSHRSAMDEIKGTKAHLNQAIDSLQSNSNTAKAQLETHISTQLEKHVEPLANTNNLILEQLLRYDAIIESQERLIEGVEHYAFQSQKNRRHG